MSILMPMMKKSVTIQVHIDLNGNDTADDIAVGVDFDELGLIA